MKLKNNADTLLYAKIESDSTSFICSEWEGELFDTENFQVWLEEREDGVVIKRESFYIATRSGDVFSFELSNRAYEECVANDSESPKVRQQGSFSFEAWKTTIRQYLSEKNLDDLEEEIASKVAGDDETVTKQWNDFNWVEQLVKTNIDWKIDTALIGVDNVEAEKLTIQGLIPGEANWQINWKDPVFLYRKWDENNWEEVDKIYKATSWEILGLYRWITEWYSNPVYFYNSSILDIYSDNSFALIAQHSQSTISSIIFKANFVWSWSFDFGIYPLINWELDENNPIFTKNWINFDIQTANTQPVDLLIDFWEDVPITPNQDYWFKIENPLWDENNKISLFYWTDYEQKDFYSFNYTWTSTQSYTYNFPAEEKDIKRMKVEVGSTTNWYYSNISFKVYQNSSLIAEKNNFRGDGIVEFNVDGSQWDLNIQVSKWNSDWTGTSSFALNDITIFSSMNNVLNLNTSVYLNNYILWILSYSLISSYLTPWINLINQWIYEHYEDIEDNTTYYITSSWELKTEASGNTEIGKSISTRKILLNI